MVHNGSIYHGHWANQIPGIALYNDTVFNNKYCTCWTVPMAPLSQSGDRSLTSCPPTITWPWTGSYRRSSNEPRVLFPEPLGPTTAVTDPAGTSRSSPRKIGISDRDGYAKCTSLNWIPLFKSCMSGRRPPNVKQITSKEIRTYSKVQNYSYSDFH